MARPATSEVLEKLASHCYQTLCSKYPTLPDFPKKPVIFHKFSKVSRIVRFLQSLVARCPIYPTRGRPAPAGLVLSQRPVWLCEKNQLLQKLVRSERNRHENSTKHPTHSNDSPIESGRQCVLLPGRGGSLAHQPRCSQNRSHPIG